MSRCTGHCCRRFHLGWTPERFATVEVHPQEDNAIVHEMLVFLELGVLEDGTPNGGAWYTCKFFRENADGTGDCTNYEKRPTMCRDFPEYGKPGTPCPFQDRGCTLQPRGRYHRLPIYADTLPMKEDPCASRP